MAARTARRSWLRPRRGPGDVRLFSSRDDVQFFAYELLCSTCTVALAPTRSGSFRPLLPRPRSARPGRGGHSASTLPRGWFGACKLLESIYNIEELRPDLVESGAMRQLTAAAAELGLAKL
jgi:hypothetical protein